MSKHSRSDKSKKSKKSKETSGEKSKRKSNSKGSDDPKRIQMKEHHKTEVFKRIRDNHDALYGKIDSNDGFTDRVAKWKEILSYAQGLGYKYKTYDQIPYLDSILTYF